MHRTRTIGARPAAGPLLILAILLVAAACGTASSPAAPATGSPGMPASAPPASQPPASDAPTLVPGAIPSAAPSEPADGAIRLDIADPHEVAVAIRDPEGALTGAASGRAGDGMSVRWGDVAVANVDEDSLRVTWVGLPVDALVGLAVEADGEGYVLTLTQPAPPANSDATGFDRVIVLDFGSTIRADAVRTAVVAAG